MSLLAKIQKGKLQLPRRVMIYGTHGIGKSTFGAMAEAPIFIQTEDGLNDIGCERFPLACAYGEIMPMIKSLYEDDHAYKTVVIDSLDWLERLIFARVSEDENVESIDMIGYQKGYAYALKYWREVLAGLNALRIRRAMTIILVAHCQIEKFINPETEAYDRYSPKLHKYANAMIQEWCDEVLFANYKVHAIVSGKSFDKTIHRGVGGDRVLWTTERPAHLAKNRLGLPDEIPLDYRVYAGYVRGELPVRVSTPSDDQPQQQNSEQAA